MMERASAPPAGDAERQSPSPCDKLNLATIMPSLYGGIPQNSLSSFGMRVAS